MVGAGREGDGDGGAEVRAVPLTLSVDSAVGLLGVDAAGRGVRCVLGRSADLLATGADGDGIRADTEKAGVAQAHLPGKAHEQIEPDDGQREDKNKRADAIIVSRREKIRQDDDNGCYR